MPEPARDATSSRGARNYRRLMWLIVLVSLLPLAVVLAGLNRVVPKEMALSAVPILFACLGFAGWMGWRGHQQALADRERAGSQAMILVIAAQLKHQDEPTLQRIAAQKGPAGEAATWILKGRRDKQLSSS